MPERTVTVQGYGTAPVRPDGVRLRLIVRRVAPTPDTALDEATQRSHVLESLLQELGIDPAAWTTDLIAPLMREAVGRAEAEVAGPWWHVAPENDAVSEACRRAVQDAGRKAEALASALGASVGGVRSVTEPARWSHAVGYQPTAAFVGLSSAGPEDMTLQQGGLETIVSVEVVYELRKDAGID